MVRPLVSKQSASWSAPTSNFTARFAEFYMSESLRNSKCYVKCDYRPSPSGKSPCEGKSKEEYYCPLQKLKLLCRPQCFTTQDYGNHEEEL
jgi:hypothetical protein